MLLGQTKLATQEGSFLAAFIDFSEAYDGVCRKKLWECLRGYSVSGKFLVMLQGLYLENSVEVKIGDKQSDHYSLSIGLRQGCVLSPLLFSLYINGLVVELKWKRCGVEVGACSFLDCCLLMTLSCLVRMLRDWNRALWSWRNSVQDGG